MKRIQEHIRIIFVVFLVVVYTVSDSGNRQMSQDNGERNGDYTDGLGINNQEKAALRFHKEKRYDPTWESLDSRPIPQWYDDAKIGIFLHWGVFSVPSYVGAWFWYWWQGPEPRKEIIDFMKKNYRPGFTYADFAPMFTAEYYDPDHWADIFKASGAKYIVLTTKHHEGFCNWPTNHSWNWNAMDVGPKRDLVGELAVAVRKRGIRFGAYHSLFEWFHPLYIQDKANHYKTQDFVRTKTMPELFELVNTYKPDIIWSDGCPGPVKYWNSTNFLSWLYNDSPVKDYVVTNDRWCGDCLCKHGGYFTCQDHYNPKTRQARKFEDPTTMDKKAWEFRRNLNLQNIHTMEEVITLIVQVVSCGGNLLINVGPTKEGIIVPIFEERLRQMGQWLEINGEGIYTTQPWTYQNDTINPDVWYTSKRTEVGTDIYAILLKWPESQTLTLASPMPSYDTIVTLLGYPSVFRWVYHTGSDLEINVPTIPANEMPCKWAWVFKITKVLN